MLDGPSRMSCHQSRSRILSVSVERSKSAPMADIENRLWGKNMVSSEGTLRDSEAVRRFRLDTRWRQASASRKVPSLESTISPKAPPSKPWDRNGMSCQALVALGSQCGPSNKSLHMPHRLFVTPLAFATVAPNSRRACELKS
jgi:hypothetical protein